MIGQRRLAKAGKEAVICKNRFFALPEPTFRYVFNLLSGKKVLDLGCRDGKYLSLLTPDSIGLDLDFQALKFCRTRGLKVVRADLNEWNLPFRRSTFDAVLLSHVLEHVEAPVQLLKKVNPLLRPEGLLVIGLPVEGGIVGLKYRYYNGPEGHLYSFSLHNLQKPLRITGYIPGEIYFSLVKIGRRRTLCLLNDVLQKIPDDLLLHLSSTYLMIAYKISELNTKND